VKAIEGVAPFRGYETWYRVVGEDAPGRLPLLCLHGGPGSTHHYFEPLERLAEGVRRVVLYDQLGCGGSSRPDDDAIYSLGLFLDELDSLRTALGLERVHLLGSSWGGMLALEHVLARPDGVAGLVLSSTLCSADQWTEEVARLRDELPPAERALLVADDRGAPGFAEAEALFDRRHFHRLDPPHPAVARGLLAKSRRPYEAMWGPNEWSVTGELAGWDVCGRLGEIRSPTLVVHGGHDLCTPPIARRLVDGIGGAEYALLEHASHTPATEESERYLALVGDFLDRAERAAG
jgi:proline-specific peptidase